MILSMSNKGLSKITKISNFFKIFKHNINKDIDNIQLADIILAYDVFYTLSKTEKMSIFINFGENIDIIVYDPDKTPFTKSYLEYRYTLINTIPEHMEYQFSC